MSQFVLTDILGEVELQLDRIAGILILVVAVHVGLQLCTVANDLIASGLANVAKARKPRHPHALRGRRASRPERWAHAESPAEAETSCKEKGRPAQGETA